MWSYINQRTPVINDIQEHIIDDTIVNMNIVDNFSAILLFLIEINNLRDLQ